ncbi:hypothetical protein KJ765_00150 [Candidatus Micrarchaeota archaeon]|nr:hypothetical protein [Candidatus Micrarchaeota archaeon]
MKKRTLKRKAHAKKRLRFQVELPQTRKKMHPFSAVRPFLIYLVLLIAVLFGLNFFFNIAISPLAFILLIAFVSLVAAAIIYAYELHAREAEDEDIERLMRQDLRRTKELMAESNSAVFQYLK